MATIYLLLLDSGETVERLRPDPNLGEVVTDTARVRRRLEWHERYDWDRRRIVARDAGEIEAELLARIDAERDRRSGGPREAEYAAKAHEAGDPVGPWPWMEAEAEERGVSLEIVRAGILARAATDPRPRTAGVAVAGKAKVRTATTVDAKLAACAAIPWPPFGE